MFKRFLAFLCILPFALFSTGAKAPGAVETVTLTSANTLVMDMEYSDETVAKVALAARDLDANLPAGKPIYLVLLSPGGSIEAGLELIQNLNAMGRTIHTFSLFAASMAFQNVQGVPGTRYISSTGVLMAHKAKGEFKGEFPGQLDSRYSFYIKRLNKLDAVTVSRSRGYYTLQSFQAAYENELWCEGQDCVTQGLADQTVLVACDKSLDGTTETTSAAELMGIPIEVTVVKAACPTITGALKVKVKAAGKDITTDDLNTLSTKLNLTPQIATELRTLVDRKIEELTPSRDSQGY